MRLVTASYAAWRREFGAPVVASLALPKTVPEAASWPRCWALTPRWAYFRADEQVFEQAYLAQLERYGVGNIRGQLERIAAAGFAEPQETLVVLCFESDPFACHRGIWRCWWHEHVGEWADDVSELEGRDAC